MHFRSRLSEGRGSCTHMSFFSRSFMSEIKSFLTGARAMITVIRVSWLVSLLKSWCSSGGFSGVVKSVARNRMRDFHCAHDLYTAQLMTSWVLKPWQPLDEA